MNNPTVSNAALRPQRLCSNAELIARHLARAGAGPSAPWSATEAWRRKVAEQGRRVAQGSREKISREGQMMDDQPMAFNG